eukprot:TRINITY_DN8457_c0_g1_i3.p1 TRINITY_DN8457_c0_g1~~TRINITY_DN8457_c0_g1_i3.p1  ORF type:complete len:213 (-),score=51.53 TRINITY_DN8457_c0_g1_i3:161-799(-)
MPKCGVYSECEDPDAIKKTGKAQFTDPYEIPPIPSIKLSNASSVLQTALEETRNERIFVRAKLIPLYELYNEDELQDLVKEFRSVAGDNEYINFVNLNAILLQMNLDRPEEEIEVYLRRLDENVDKDHIDLDTFARLVAVLLDEVNDPNYGRGEGAGAGGEGQKEVIYESQVNEGMSDFQNSYEDEYRQGMCSVLKRLCSRCCFFVCCSLEC